MLIVSQDLWPRKPIRRQSLAPGAALHNHRRTANIDSDTCWKDVEIDILRSEMHEALCNRL